MRNHFTNAAICCAAAVVSLAHVASAQSSPPSGQATSAEAVSNDFTPLTDLRASAAYRSRVAGNLVVKAIAEIAGVSPGITRIADHRMVADAAE